MNFLKGYKTKIGLLAVFVLGGLKAINVIDDTLFNNIMPFILAWTGYGIYDKLNR